MIKNLKMFLIGVVLLLTPFLGFPLFWKFAIVFLLALVIILYSIEIRISMDSFRLKGPKDFIKQNFSGTPDDLKESIVDGLPKEKKPRKKKEKIQTLELGVLPEDIVKEETISELEVNAIDTLESDIDNSEQKIS